MKESTRHCADVAERDISKDIYLPPKAYLLKIRGGVDVDSYGKKAGKGPLIQEEVSATLGVSQDQYLFQPVEPTQSVYAVTTKGNGDAFINSKTHTALSVGGGQAGQGYPCVLLASENIAGTLDSHYWKGQGEREGVERTFVVLMKGEIPASPGTNRYPFHPTGVDIYNFSVTGEKSRCLSTSGGGLNEHIPVVIESALPIVYDARGNGGGGVVNTITGDHENRITDYTSVVVSEEERRAQHEDDREGNEVFYEAYQHHGWRESVVAGTLTADQNNGVRGDTPVIVMATQQGGAEIAVNFCPTTTAAAGMSGNNQPVVCIEGNGSRPSHFGDGYRESDVMYTLNTIDRHAVAYESNKP